MNTARWIVVVCVAALLSALGGYMWADHGSSEAGATADAAAGSGKVLYWRDPMKPELRFDKPGKSPYMNMALMPVYANDKSDPGGVAVSANMRQSLGIRLGRVAKAVMTQSIGAVGSVAYDERRTTLVQARTSGFVVKLHVKAAQDRVRQGQPLAEVTVPAWVEAEGEYLALLSEESDSNATLRGPARERLLLLGVPEAAVLALEQERTVRSITTLTAPIDGVMVELGVREGAAFADGMLLFRLNGVETVWVNAQVLESQAGVLAPGSSAEVRAAAWPGQVFTGRIQAILPQLDPATRTLTARIVVDNRRGRLTPGMFVNAAFKNPVAAAQLWVPSEAVIVTGHRSVVIRERAGGAFEAVDVTIGTEAGGRTAILTGLEEGQSVVLSGQFLIDSEANLESTVNRLSASSSTAPESMP